MEDLLKIDSLLTHEEKLARDTVRRFVDDEVIPVMPHAFESGQFPEHLLGRIGQLRLLGMGLPEEFGGTPASTVALGLVAQELERGDSALRSFVSVQNALCLFPIFRFGSTDQKERYLNRMTHGEFIGCFALTEPNAGSDPASMQCTARKVSGGYLLNGSKTWITNASIANVSIVWAKTEEGIRGFLIDMEIPGISVQAIKHKLSMRSSATGSLFFEDCFVTDATLLPGTSTGLPCALQCLNEARYSIAWGATGAAMACYEIALDYTLNRKQFNKPLASNQLVQKDLVDMWAGIVQAQLLTLHLGRLKEQKLLEFQMVSLAKMANAQNALHVARLARNLLGANGISLEYHVIRHLANLETVFTYEGTDNIHHLIIGKFLTGLSAF